MVFAMQLSYKVKLKKNSIHDAWLMKLVTDIAVNCYFWHSIRSINMLLFAELYSNFQGYAISRYGTIPL